MLLYLIHIVIILSKFCWLSNHDKIYCTSLSDQMLVGNKRKRILRQTNNFNRKYKLFKLDI